MLKQEQNVHVKGHIRDGRFVQAYTSRREKESNPNGVLVATGAAIGAFAVIAGVSISSMVVLRRKHKMDVSRIAKQIQQNPSKFGWKVHDIPTESKKPIIYFSDGMRSNNESVHLRQMFLTKNPNKIEHTPTPKGLVETPLGWATDYQDKLNFPLYEPNWYKNDVTVAPKRYLEVLVKQGMSDDSINIAATAYRQHLQNPNSPIILMGHSQGSVVTLHAQELLEALNVPTYTINTAGYWSGVERVNKDYIVNLAPRNDFLRVMQLPATNWEVMDEGYHLPHVYANAEWRKRVEKHFAIALKRFSERDSIGTR